MARHILKHSQGLQDHKIMHPERDWLIGLGLALVIFTGSAIGSVYTYWKNKNIEVTPDESTVKETVVYREAVVKDALASFEKRNKEREALIAQFSGAELKETVSEATTTISTSPTATTTTEAVITEEIITSGL